MTSTRPPRTRTDTERNRAAFGRFTASARRMRPTLAHRPALWENMLGTIYAANKARDVVYFDYDYELALLHVGAHADVRVHRLTHATRVGDDTIPAGKLVWFVRDDETNKHAEATR